MTVFCNIECDVMSVVRSKCSLYGNWIIFLVHQKVPHFTIVISVSRDQTKTANSSSEKITKLTFRRLCADQIETSTSPAPRVNLGHLTTFCAWGMGNLAFVLAGWGKLNRKCKVSNEIFFFGAEVANNYKHVFGRSWKSLKEEILQLAK